MQELEETVLEDSQQIEQAQEPLRLNYSIKDPQERVKIVNKIIEQTPSEKLNNKYLEILANYIILAKTKKQKKQEYKLNTDNAMVTINKRETSFQGLVSKFENGEDGIYNMIINNDKNVLLTPKYEKVTEKDLQQMPELRQLYQAIENVEQQAKHATGRRKYLLKQQIIQMRKDQYIIKNSYRPVIYSLNLIKSFSNVDLSDYVEINEKGELINKGLISLFNPIHISILLCNYSKIKEDCWDKFNSDIFYMMKDLEDIVDGALKENYPLYYDIVILKIDGKQNIQIQQQLYSKYNTTHSIEYISSLWRKKIPKLIADYQEKQYLEWYYTFKEKGKWKRCSRCGQIKLAHNKFFSKNNTSKDKFYSICKECRNNKTKKG